MHNHFHSLIVEGTSGVGKSTLIDGLIRRHVVGAPPRKVRSLTHLAQTHTYGPLAPAEDRGTLRVEENRAHLERIVCMLEWLHDAHAHSPQPSFSIIDTLHVTHCRRPGVVTWSDVASFDERLAAIGCKLVVLTAQRDTLKVRSIEARAGSQFLDDYARKFGNSHEEILDYFAGEQRDIVELASRSKMRTIRLSADIGEEVLVDAAYDFWQA